MPDDSNSEPLAPGTVLDRYELLRLLGSGATGELYLAKTNGAGGFSKQVALKRLKGEFARLPEFERTLIDEAQLMASLHHPNIAQVYDAGYAEQGAYFTLEFVHGKSLRETLVALAQRGRGLGLENALFIVSSIAAGLHYAHAKKSPAGIPLGLVHRDVSPNNIMLSLDGTVKLIDFGIARALGRTSKTAPGTVRGNTRYMSPEQLLGGTVAHQADIFALGILLFELTTGTRWLRERDDQKAIQQVLHGPYPLPSERRSGYSKALEAIVMKALEPTPSARYEDAQQIQQALQDFAQTQGITLSNIALSEMMAATFSEEAKASTEQSLEAQHQQTRLQYPQSDPRHPRAGQIAAATPARTQLGYGQLPDSAGPTPLLSEPVEPAPDSDSLELPLRNVSRSGLLLAGGLLLVGAVVAATFW